MLVDEVEVIISGGDGGEGKVSFGKGAKSGPDGGNGGKGGNVYVVASSDLTLLNQFAAKNKINAENGVDGGKEKMAGRMGENTTLFIPVGSALEDLSTNEVIELSQVGQKILLCRGGKGGVGNFDLRSSRNITPLNSIPPKKGQKRKLKIVLSFIADFGLVGLPSSGKSSLLNELTNANVKTAKYHFTTLSPNLGVLSNKKIIADIPGLIEGASKGKGLGIKFLKHIQKVGLLLHCISCESSDAVKNYKIIRKELGEYDKNLLKKREIIVLTKNDLIDNKKLRELQKMLKSLDKKILTTSIYDLRSIGKLLRVLD
ncbi:MAG: Obg family GTPase CgtA [Patescibacteria group bacterium]